MIDRIEELLGLLAAEDDEEQEQENVFALPEAEKAVPAPPHRDEGEAGDGETGDRSGGRTAGEILSERPGLIAGETEAESVPDAGELWKDGPVWTVRGRPPEMDTALRAAAAQRKAQAEGALRLTRDGDLTWYGPGWAAQGGTTGPVLADGTERLGPVQAGLKGLYRQTVQGLRPAAPALPPEQVGRTVRTQEPGSAASLAVDELDRAVRRDSRRYDGGMSIF